METNPILSMKGIDKSFPGVHALQNLDFELKAGEVCGILGENGAGKSTLMNVLGGVYSSDAGQIFLDGKEVNIRNTKMAENLGISFIHQELSLFRNLDLATNIYIQNLPKRFGRLNKRKLMKDARAILDRVGLKHCRPEQRAGELKIGEQQLVEIGRMLAQNTKILILDEPTSSLTNSEIKILFKIVKNLQSEGVAVIFITHRMDEIFEICDSVMIMRDGEKILKTGIKDISREDVIKNMLGRDVKEQYEHMQHEKGELLLRVSDLSRKNKLNHISFEVQRGELVGLYGLMGSGRTEVLRSIFGLDKYDSGEIYYKGQKLDIKNPKQAIQKNIAMVTEERRKEGLVLGRSVAFNLVLSNLKAIKGKLLVKRAKEQEIARRRIGELSIKTPTTTRGVQYLSGGNQQKVVLAKWLETAPDLLLLDEPTRGVDIGAKREIYNIIDNLLAQGMGIIMVSSELPEIMGLCDQVVVLKEGSVVTVLSGPEQITSIELLKAAMGG
jgi:ribose transport system ATP-binding protein